MALPEVVECGDSGNVIPGEWEGDPDPVLEFAVRPDNGGTEFESESAGWFNFMLVGGDAREGALGLAWAGCRSVKRMTSHGFRPVYRVLDGCVGTAAAAGRLPTHDEVPFTYVRDRARCDDRGRLCFSVPAPGPSAAVQVAYSFPYPMADVSRRMASIPADLVYEVVQLCPALSPRFEMYKIARDRTLPVVFINARCHPGETPGSYVLDGILASLPRLLSLVQLWVIPAMNPEAVIRGNYRADVRGQNLNRLYAPEAASLPEGVPEVQNEAAQLLRMVCATGVSIGMASVASSGSSSETAWKCLERAVAALASPVTARKSSKSVFPEDRSTHTSPTAVHPPGKPRTGSITVATTIGAGARKIPRRGPPGTSPAAASPQSRSRSLSAEDAEISSISLAGIPLELPPAAPRPRVAEAFDIPAGPGRDQRRSAPACALAPVQLPIPRPMRPPLPLHQPKPSITHTPKIVFILDLHAHASFPNCFLFGNSLFSTQTCGKNNMTPDALLQHIRNVAFSTLMAASCQHLDPGRCDFRPESMARPDRNGETAEGTMRVGMLAATGLPTIYTFEAHYFRCERGGAGPRQFLPADFRDMGAALAKSIRALLSADKATLTPAIKRLESSLLIGPEASRALRGFRMEAGPEWLDGLYTLVSTQISAQMRSAKASGDV